MSDKPTVIDFRKRRFVQVTREVLHNEAVLTKSSEIAVYAVLCMYADNITKETHPSVATIAKKARCSEKSVQRAIQALKDAGYIDVVNRTDRNGFKTSNQYVLLDVEESVVLTERIGHSDRTDRTV